MKKKLSVLLIGLLLLVGCSPAGNNTNTAGGNNGNNAAPEAEATELDKDKVYVLGLDDTFAPMGFRDESGELVGFDVELAKDAADKMGIKLEFQPIEWSMKETELKSGTIDFIWNGYSITPEREKEVALSTPYLENRQIIVTMADSDVNSKEDLYDKQITVQAESSALDAMNKDTEFMDKLEKPFVEYATNVECFKDVEAGRSDAIVVDEVLARYYMKQNGEDKYKVLDDNFGEEEFAVGMRKEDTALVEALNKAFEEQKEDGTYDKLYKKWFSDN